MKYDLGDKFREPWYGNKLEIRAVVFCESDHYEVSINGYDPVALSEVFLDELEYLGSITEGLPSACRHEWVSTLGIYKVYQDCKHCGAKAEEVEVDDE